jgi:type IV secretory pathway component VirB8
MHRKVTVRVTFNLKLSVDEGVEVSHVLNEMDYSFSDTTTSADVLDSNMTDFEVVDSK